MDSALVEFLKNTPLPVILGGALFYIAKLFLKKMEEHNAEKNALIEKYHLLTIEVTKQLTIIAEELKED
jgi:hypothetical protein